MKILPTYAAKFPNLMANYQPPAAKMQELAGEYGITVVFMPAGPLLEFNPDKVKQVPTTPQELLAWCKANPNKLIYARPANSGPLSTRMVFGLPRSATRRSRTSTTWKARKLALDTLRGPLASSNPRSSGDGTAGRRTERPT